MEQSFHYRWKETSQAWWTKVEHTCAGVILNCSPHVMVHTRATGAVKHSALVWAALLHYQILCLRVMRGECLYLLLFWCRVALHLDIFTHHTSISVWRLTYVSHSKANRLKKNSNFAIVQIFGLPQPAWTITKKDTRGIKTGMEHNCLLTACCKNRAC